jgi:Cys-tRNA(Pro)/Cys-tRNA(Cys) deacylase
LSVLCSVDWVPARGREITLGTGEHGLALAVDADEILQALNASVADISDPGPAT